MKKPWLTISELADEAGVETEVVRINIRSGLLDRWARLEGGMLRFRPETTGFLRWANGLVEQVSAGQIEPVAASERIWQRARRPPAR